MFGVKSALTRLLNFIYPPRCAFCYQLITGEDGSGGVCVTCKNSLPFCVKQPCCIKCGIPLKHSMAAHLCGDCERSEKNFARNISVLVYKDTVKSSVLRYKGKKNGKRQYSKVYAEYIAGVVGYCYNDIHFDCVVSVPTSQKSIRRSGFDHGMILAKSVAAKIGVPYIPKSLVKTRDTNSQKHLSREERELNLIGAFKVQNADKIKGKRILLIDDVFTTGSTINECCYMLLKGGVVEVYSATLAITTKK